MHEAQRELRLHDPNWAIAYLPDKHGDFMARAFIEFVSKVQLVNDPYNTCGCITCVSARRDRAAQEINHVKVYKIYGNGLSHETIMNSIMGKYNMECRPSLDDKYLSEY